MTSIPVAVDIAFPLNFAVFKKISTSARRTPTPSKPFAISSQLKPLRALTADAITLIAAANITIATALDIAFLLNFAVAMKASSSANNTPTPTRPLASSPQLRLAIFFTALDRTRTAAANTISFPAPLLDTPPSLLNTAIAAISSVIITVIAPREPASLSLSTREIATIDAAKIPIAVAIFINVPAFN